MAGKNAEERIAAIEQKIAKKRGEIEVLEAQKRRLLHPVTMKGVIAKAKEAGMTAEEIAEKLESVQAELGEKVHSENVKCYRNVQVLVEELEQKVDLIMSGEGMGKLEKRFVGLQIGLAVINLIGIVIIVGRVLGFY